MDIDLTKKKCVPCEAGTKPLNKEEMKRYLNQLKTPWNAVEDKKINRKFAFKDFKKAMAFVNKVADLAEKQGHHPDIHIYYNKVSIVLWTHAISGLSENDFIMAAKIESLGR